MSEELTEEQLAAAKKQLESKRADRLKDIQQQLFSVGATDLYQSETSVAELPDELADDEAITYATAAFVNNDNTLVVITTKRVLFVNSDKANTIMEVAFDHIKDVSFKKKLLFANVRIKTDTTEILLDSLEKKNAPIFVEKLQSKMHPEN